MFNSKICPTCGHRVMRNKHRFSRSLADILLKIAEKYTWGTPFHLQRDLNLTKNEYTNAQKLKYFGLLEKHHNSGGKHIVGIWIITPLGRRLIRGEQRIPEWVETYQNNVVDQARELTGIGEVKGTYYMPKMYALEQKAGQISKEQQGELFGGKAA